MDILEVVKDTLEANQQSYRILKAIIEAEDFTTLDTRNNSSLKIAGFLAGGVDKYPLAQNSGFL